MVKLPIEYCDKAVTPFGGMTMIKEFKQDFGLDAFCVEDFWAKKASFHFIMAAYNLRSLFRHFALNGHEKSTLSTLRNHCFAIGAWVSQHARKKVLKLSLVKQK